MNPSPATSAWCFSICTIGTPPCADASPERPALWQTATGRVPRIGALTAGKTALAVRYGRQAIRRRSTAGTCSISGYANAGSSPAASLVILSLDIPERRGRAAAPARLYMAADGVSVRWHARQRVRLLRAASHSRSARFVPCRSGTGLHRNLLSDLIGHDASAAGRYGGRVASGSRAGENPAFITKGGR